MEHEVFVPVPAERLREVLDDPARVARAVPGLQQDAGAEPVAGRLKIRVGSHSVTYRGAVRVSRRGTDTYGVEGSAQESRGSGSVTLALRIALREAEDGCTVLFDAAATADGRIRDLPADAVEGAVTRLLNRFAEHLGQAAPETTGPPAPGTTTPPAPQDADPRATADHETTPGADEPPPPTGGGAAGSGEEKGAGRAPGPESGLTEGPRPGFGTGVPPSPLDPVNERDAGDEDDAADEDDDEADEDVAEAAHARRTMIGRSAEEVDHAPPRGRYAPVPAPQTVAPPGPLRWAAPAAALAVASAIVAVRALRRRR
ncbi:SRPBCC domain-containing protein [Streptomyces dubilierae]|uniref:SRPBCC domain-containing protein n=1 Tax=Streptomyces dubilierae TaxID=3075533 RepID=A0ABU2P1A1_9ACTN|nr:SRPBCC domain-containing protein [Streptomyces sp. DSM 41921]MDT0385914.1 SRPBCC domain-containing protein [Streptomyces sp. DSM 41921]